MPPKGYRYTRKYKDWETGRIETEAESEQTLIDMTKMTTRTFAIKKAPIAKLKNFNCFDRDNILIAEFDEVGQLTHYKIVSPTGTEWTDTHATQLVFQFFRDWVDWNDPDFCTELKKPIYVPGQYIVVDKTTEVWIAGSSKTAHVGLNHPYMVTGFEPISGYVRIDVGGNICRVPSTLVAKVVDVYYFINSEGKVMHTFVGKNPQRDRWLKNSGNFFDTAEEAKKLYDQVMSAQ